MCVATAVKMSSAVIACERSTWSERSCFPIVINCSPWPNLPSLLLRLMKMIDGRFRKALLSRLCFLSQRGNIFFNIKIMTLTSFISAYLLRPWLITVSVRFSPSSSRQMTSFTSHPLLFLCTFSLSYSVWPRPVHSEHQIRFAGRCYAVAAERDPSHAWWVIGAWQASSRHSLPSASSRPAHTTHLHPESELWSGESEPSCPWGPAPLPHARRRPLAPRHASLHKPAGPQPHGTLLQPCQPGLSTRGLGQRPGQTQLRLNRLMRGDHVHPHTVL